MSGFGFLHRTLKIFQICSRHFVEIAVDRFLKRRGLPGPERLRQLLEELSGSFLKFGQILSLQIDALPREYCDALLSLLDRVPPFPRDQVRQVFLREMGKPPEDLYLKFDYTPIASASIGQVHRAVLRDSTPVAVKVQRPGIEDIFLRDAVLLKLFVRVVFLLRIRSLYFMRDPVREFNDWVLDELDYRREASYAEVLGRNAKATPNEKIPRIYWDLTTSRVLTMDFLTGYSVMEYLRLRDRGDTHRLEELQGLGFDPSAFVWNVINNFLSDAYRFGVFHADLHPANLLILENNVVGYVDFGIVGSLTPEAIRKQIQLNLAYVSGSNDEIYDAFLNVCTFAEGADLAGFRRELERRSRLWYREPAIGGVPHFSRSLTVAMIDLLTLTRYYGVLVDREIIKYIRSLFLADGLVSRLAPGLDLAPRIRKVCEDFLAREAERNLFSGGAALTALADLAGWITAGPGRMIQAIELIERRQLRLQTRSGKEENRHEGLRARALAVAAVWLVLGVVSLAGKNSVLSEASLSGYLLLSFWAAWTVWLAGLVRQLTRD